PQQHRQRGPHPAPMTHRGAGVMLAVATLTCMSKQVPMEPTIEGSLDEVLAGRTDTSASVEQMQQARRRLLDAGAAAVPTIEARLASGSFEDKRRCYALLIEMGDRIAASFQQGLASRPPAVVVW